MSDQAKLEPKKYRKLSTGRYIVQPASPAEIRRTLKISKQEVAEARQIVKELGYIPSLSMK